MGDSPIHEYTGGDVDVTWDERLCIHAAECIRRAPAAFDTGRRPWILPDEESADTVMQAVHACPSGALAATRKDGGAPEEHDPANTIRVTAGGPLYVRGELRVGGADGDSPGVGMRAALCRCGESEHKPFCDNAHDQCGFADPGDVAPGGEPGQEGGPLTVTPAANGPLLVNGGLTIADADGKPAWHGTKTALCRCGHSGNKPFCDGTHAKIGFRSG